MKASQAVIPKNNAEYAQRDYWDTRYKTYGPRRCRIP